MSSVRFYTIELKEVPHLVFEWLKEIIKENNCFIEKEEWRNKNNRHSVCNYKPSISINYCLNIYIKSSSKNYIEYVKHLYEKKLKTIEYFKKCLEKQQG